MLLDYWYYSISLCELWYHAWIQLVRIHWAVHLWLVCFSQCISSVQSLNHVQLLATPWTAACQASLSITNSQSLLKFMSIELVMPSNHLILCCSLLLPPSIFPSIRVFPNESVLHWVAKVLEFQLQRQSFQWIIQDWFPLGWTGWISL